VPLLAADLEVIPFVSKNVLNNPLLPILIRSVGELAPSAVVENTKRVGWLVPEVQVPPSRAARIVTELLWLLSLKAISPKPNPSAGDVVPRAKISFPFPDAAPEFP
jgi:hypothetical protein